MSKRTPLYPQHQNAGAKFVDFHGWEMPLHYGSQIAEHMQVRQDAGMFDVSHMTIIDLLGAGGRQFLRYLLSNDIDRLPHVGKALYSCLLNQHGGIIDDLLVYVRGPDNFRLITNSATRDQVVPWIHQQAEGFAVNLYERTEYAIIAIQGPQAIAKTMTTLTPAQLDTVSTLQSFEAKDVDRWLFARTGYTGEDGLEVMLPSEQAAEFWQALITAGVKPCGLGARDTLRLEAGLMLSGQDMDETTTPLESGLEWTVCWQPEDRDFIGKESLLIQKQQGVKRKIVGLVLQSRGVMRPEQRVIIEGVGEGKITSGSYSPILQQSIALARVPVNTVDHCMVMIRDELVPATVVKPRFVKQGKRIV